MRRRLVFSATVIFLIMLVCLQSCGGDNNVNLVFSQDSGTCAYVTQSSATIQCNGGVITFNGSAVTPDPCYYLTAMIDTSNNSNVVISITTQSAFFSGGGYCAECVGEVAFSGELSPSGSCSRDVSIIYNGSVIADYGRP